MSKTPAENVNHLYITGISFIAALGGYLFGFDFAVISGGLPFLEKYFGLNAYWEGFTTGSLALGAMTGCLIAGSMAERLGRKPALLTAALVFALSSLAMAFSPNRDLFIASRFSAGIGVGMASMLSPMYIAELAPASFRGRLVAINQLTIVLGILITNLINYTLRNSGEDAWRWMFGLGVVPSIIFFGGVLALPESPRWLVSRNKKDKASHIFNKIGNIIYAAKAMADAEQSLLSGPGSNKGNYKMLFSKICLPAIIIGIVLAVFQQFCGINTVFNYTPKLFEHIGASADNQLLQTVFVGIVNLAFTILAILLVDKVGRKPLMLIGAGGLCILYIIIAQMLGAENANVAWFLLAAIGIYALTLAPVTWVLIAEIFPGQVRTEAMTVAVLFLWAAYFILVFTFPILFEKLGVSTFYLYSVICFGGLIFVSRFVKETKGKTLGQINESPVVSMH
jgi:sugar porter (SP) family MFS transporter